MAGLVAQQLIPALLRSSEYLMGIGSSYNNETDAALYAVFHSSRALLTCVRIRVGPTYSKRLKFYGLFFCSATKFRKDRPK